MEIESEQSPFVVEEGLFIAAWYRLRYQPLVILRKSLRWGARFALFIMGLLAFRGPKPGAPSLTEAGFVSFGLAAAYAVICEVEWRRLTISSDEIGLLLGNNRVISKNWDKVRNLEILSRSGAKVVIRIHWVTGQGDSWVVAGKIQNENPDDVLKALDEWCRRSE
ncbi:hypothetical protein [Gimesia sp.]|uniref:hypothetical protein n=1 Tax=Gimesia sp. TaxID=2024833 RepID=UPI003A930EF2